VTNPSEPPAAVLVAPSDDAPRVVSLLWWWLGAAVLVLVSATALAVAWKAQARVHEIEQELVRRQQDSQGVASEARTLAKQAQESARDAAAKAALLDARVAEVALQRGQLEELIQSF
jgi:uroporphyrin-3 C-methyltransferase